MFIVLGILSFVFIPVINRVAQSDHDFRRLSTGRYLFYVLLIIIFLMAGCIFLGMGLDYLG